MAKKISLISQKIENNEFKEELINFYDFKSEIIPIVLGGRVNLVHGWQNYNPLDNPAIIQGFLLCKKNVVGYIEGDLITSSRGIDYQITSTELIIRFSNQGVYIIRADNNRSRRIRASEFDFIVSMHLI